MVWDNLHRFVMKVLIRVIYAAIRRSYGMFREENSTVRHVVVTVRGILHYQQFRAFL